MRILFVFVFLSSVAFGQSNNLPKANKKIIEFCNQSMGKKIDRGECWDFAVAALNYSNSKWSNPFNFGNVINPNNQIIFEGDIIQFKNVELKGGTTYPQHTAIVYKVLAKKKYLIAHQNFCNVRKVNTEPLELSKLSKGTITFYRPIEKQ